MKKLFRKKFTQTRIAALEAAAGVELVSDAEIDDLVKFIGETLQWKLLGVGPTSIGEVEHMYYKKGTIKALKEKIYELEIERLSDEEWPAGPLRYPRLWKK